MGIRPATDVGSQIKIFDACSSANSGAASLITAGGTGDGTKQTGQTLDTLDATGGKAKSCKLATAYLASLADGETISLTHELQESADGSSWDTAEVVEAVTVKATSSGGTNERGSDEHEISLVGRKRYIRFNVTGTMSAGSSDTAQFHTVAVFGGYDNTPS